VAVVLASIDARATLHQSIARWHAETAGHGELIVVDASGDRSADEVASCYPGIRLLRRRPGLLVPELWRDGLEAADAPFVALSTLQMIPEPGWRQAMLMALEATGAAVVGGPIKPPAFRNFISRSVYLLRYVNYHSRVIEQKRVEPPGDNAVYVRDRLRGLEALWRDGFWEVEVHRALRARGERLTMASDAAVVFDQASQNFAALLGQRYAHARRYGAGRAQWLGIGRRLGHIAATPLVPLLFLCRIAAALAVRGESMLSWLPSFPWTVPLLVAWSLGEAHGMAIGLPSGERPAMTSSSPTERLRRVGEAHMS
jgi:hypothetical protein